MEHLWDHGEGAAEGGEAQTSDVHAIDERRATVRLHDAEQHQEQRRLTATCTVHDAEMLPSSHLHA